MRKLDGNEPAFPYEEKNGDGSHYFSTPGMTLRDYFAAQSITAALMKARHNFAHDGEEFSINWTDVAESAYDAADAMLAARKGGV